VRRLGSANSSSNMTSSTAPAAAELGRLRQLDADARLTGSEIAGPERPQTAVLVVQQVTVISTPPPAPIAASPVPLAVHTPAPVVATAPADDFGFGSAAMPPSASPSASPATLAEDDVDLPLTESVSAEIRRLEATVHELTDTNDRIMAQNIALLADLEVAQKAVRELRAEKNALATQVRRVLTAAAATATATTAGGS